MKLELSDEQVKLIIRALQHSIDLKYGSTPRYRALKDRLIHSYHLSKAHRRPKEDFKAA